MGEKSMEDKSSSFRDVMTEFMGYTTGHGFGRLVAATSFVWRAFWIIAVIGAFGMFIFEVTSLFELFLSRPVQTSVSVTFEKQLQFPAVTICNLNMIRRSSMMHFPEDLMESFPFNYSYYAFDDKKNLTTDAQKNLTTDAQKNLTTDAQKNLTTDSKKNLTTNAQKNLTTDAKTDAGQASTTAGPVVGKSTTKITQGTTNSTVEFSTTEKPTAADLSTPKAKVKRRRKREDQKDEDKKDEDKKDEDKKDEDKKDEDKKDEDKKTDTSYDSKEGGSHDEGKDEWEDDDYGYYDDWKKDDYYSDISDEYPDEAKVDKETKLRMKVESFIGGESPDMLSMFGHQQFDLITDCRWKGVDCNTGNFSKFWRWSWNYRYGNCYTFNDGMDDKENPLRILKSSKPGPSQGLVLQLNIEDHEYLGELSEEAGVRVVLHEPGSMSFPFEEGFSITPGMATSVGLTKTLIKRLDRFDDGSCSEEGVPLGEENLYRKYKNTTRYSLQACLNSCLGESQLARCQCAEASYPSGQEPCDVFNTEKRFCLQKVKFLFSKDQLPCIDKCKRPCREEIYEKTISASQWPSPAFTAYMIAEYEEAPNASNGLLLNIFYSKLNYQVIEETFSYGTTNLLADIGGQLGLWIGISALTCGEILELIFQLVVLAYRKLKSRKQNRVIEIGQTAG